MATLVCKKCKAPVKLDISSGLRVIVAFGISKKYLTISLGEIEYRADDDWTIEPKFFCPQCGDIEETDLLSCCIYCGNYLNPKDIFRLLNKANKQIGGEYCKNCCNIAEDFDEVSSKIPIENLIKKVYVKYSEKNRYE